MVRISLFPWFVLPMSFSCLRAFYLFYRMRQRGDYLTQKINPRQVMMDGIRRKKVTVMNQSSQMQQANVTIRAPTVKAPCTIANIFCLGTSEHCSLKREPVTITTESIPKPAIVRPITTVAIEFVSFDAITIKMPMHERPHATIIVLRRPTLSEKKVTKRKPNREPKQGDEEKRSMQKASSQKYYPKSLAKDLYQFYSVVTQEAHCYFGRAHTKSQQLVVRSPKASQSNSGLRKPSAVLRRTMPVVNQEHATTPESIY